jgi:hypothetical protein
MPRLLKVTLHELWLGLRTRRPLLFARALLAGYALSLAERRNRRPVSRDVYRLYWRLGKRGPERLEDVESRLPAARGSGRDGLAAVAQ